MFKRALKKPASLFPFFLLLLSLLFFVRMSYLLNVSNIPDVNRVIIVDDGDFEVLLVVGDGGGVRISCIGRVGSHVGDR